MAKKRTAKKTPGKIRGVSTTPPHKMKIEIDKGQRLKKRGIEYGNFRMKVVLEQLIETGDDVLVLYDLSSYLAMNSQVPSEVVSVVNGRLHTAFCELLGEVSPDEPSQGDVDFLYIVIDKYPVTVTTNEERVEVTEDSVKVHFLEDE